MHPENTMASYRAARDASIPGIELDVHLTKDGRLVVFHDDTTKRLTSDSVPDYRIEDSDYALLSSLDIGSWKGPSFAGERMPLLDEVLDEFGKTQYFDIEIKSRTVGDAGLEGKLADAIRRAGMGRRCIVSSFNPFALRRFKGLMPGLPTAIIWSRSSELYWFLRRGEGRWIGAVDVLKPQQSLFRRKRLLAALRRPLLPWTVDTEADAERVLSFGAAGIISNCPEQLSAWR
jgi:glycerophosphoryl diester phosphodiesterase